MGRLFLESTGGGRERERHQTPCLRVSGDVFAALTVVEVEPVEVHPLHQVAEPLGLKGGQTRVADLPVKKKRRRKRNFNE